MTPKRLALEMAVVGIGLLPLFVLLQSLSRSLLGQKAYTSEGLVLAQVFLAGALFHLLCEVSGINTWYCALRA
jgi:hypothetical protein